VVLLRIPLCRAPAGLQLSASLANYAAPLGHFSAGVILFFAHFHLLPESYLMGRWMEARGGVLSHFHLRQVYAHGVWWYFPAAILIKTTLGMLALVAVAGWAIAAGGCARDASWRSF